MNRDNEKGGDEQMRADVRLGMGFGRKLAEVLEAKGASQYWLAKTTGLTRQAISRVIHEEASPSWDSACKMAVALEVSIAEFFDEEDVPEVEETISNRTYDKTGPKPKADLGKAEDAEGE